MKKPFGLPAAMTIALMLVLMMVLTLFACTPADEIEYLNGEVNGAGYIDTEAPELESPEAEIGADAAMFTVTAEEAVELALAEVPGEFYNITTSEIQLEDGLQLYTWHVIIDTLRDGRVVVEIVKATGDITVLPLRR